MEQYVGNVSHTFFTLKILRLTFDFLLPLKLFTLWDFSVIGNCMSPASGSKAKEVQSNISDKQKQW